jgi:hypothetical protein
LTISQERRAFSLFSSDMLLLSPSSRLWCTQIMPAYK